MGGNAGERMRGERLGVAAEVLGVVMGPSKDVRYKGPVEFSVFGVAPSGGGMVATDAMLLGGGREPKTEGVAWPAMGCRVHCQSSAVDAFTCD